ncbi:DUF493 family protein [Cellulophaga sp. HaHaR_3_176]|uniref:DUF493 family protein n=1 Tax=Cellulophaga sp. HaHaR_3_176 TaxID=1942464 RepID=UPI001C1FF87E|nr:DUF493 family protein [Cellulophaga sp. HaHaR_3_176]QWX84899.1 DUF493 family protein [Cellulophaga sp. HaHaR_3_176]
MESEKEVEFYKTLKERLNETSSWPSIYPYKFIVPTAGSAIKEIESIFDDTKAVVSKKLSKNGKYTSVSINLEMDGPDAIIEKYKAVGEVKDVISL